MHPAPTARGIHGAGNRMDDNDRDGGNRQVEGVFRRELGLDTLEQRFEQVRLDCLDPFNRSVGYRDGL